MPAHNTNTSQKGPATKAGGKGMSKKDKRASAVNWDHIEEYIDLLKNRVIVNGLTLGRCVKAAGAGRYEIQYMDGSLANLPIAGSIRVKNSRKTHITACMSAGDIVLINGSQITGTLTASHRDRVEMALRTIQANGCYAGGSMAGTNLAGGYRIPSEFVSRVDTEARLVFPPSFFNGTETAEGETWQFDRDEEGEGEGEKEIDMEDL
jgi:hypothetical protein